MSDPSQRWAAAAPFVPKGFPSSIFFPFFGFLLIFICNLTRISIKCPFRIPTNSKARGSLHLPSSPFISLHLPPQLSCHPLALSLRPQLLGFYSLSDLFFFFFFFGNLSPIQYWILWCLPPAAAAAAAVAATPAAAAKCDLQWDFVTSSLFPRCDGLCVAFGMGLPIDPFLSFSQDSHLCQSASPRHLLLLLLCQARKWPCFQLILASWGLRSSPRRTW